MDILGLFGAMLLIGLIVCGFYFSGKVQQAWGRVIIRIASFPIAFILTTALFTVARAPLHSMQATGQYAVWLGFVVAMVALARKLNRKPQRSSTDKAV